MDAKVELVGDALTLTLLGSQGNPSMVIIGGADGILVTISSTGIITKIPPEGPGDPEAMAAFKRLHRSLRALVTIYQPCAILSEQIGNVMEQITKAQNQWPPASASTEQQLESQLASLQKNYQKNCGSTTGTRKSV